jgi:hypothetical protein
MEGGGGKRNDMSSPFVGWFSGIISLHVEHETFDTLAERDDTGVSKRRRGEVESQQKRWWSK